MSKRFLIVLVVLLGILAACSNNAASLPPQSPNPVAFGNTPIDTSAIRLDQMATPRPDTTGADDGTNFKRVILRTASLSIVVDDPEATFTNITSLTEEMGGWVVTSNTNRVQLASGGEVMRGTITVRVPAERLDEALAQLKTGVVSVNSENISGQDVTQDYVDLTSQQTNLEAAEVQLRGILEKATKTEDVLSVYNELVRVRGEIETVKGRLQYYDEASAFSSITVEVIPKAIEEPVQIAGWSPGRTAEQALAALINVLRGLADLVITLVIFAVPLALIIGVPAWLIMRTVRRNRRTTQTPKA